MGARSTSIDRNRFPVDEWALTENGVGPTSDAHDTLFAITNGVFGLRTPLRDTSVGTHATTIVNRFFETYDIVYPEDAYGLARVGQSLVPGPDISQVEIAIDGKKYLLSSTRWTRTLDLRSGCLRRTFQLTLPSGSLVVLTHITFVSQHSPQRAFQRWRAEVEEGGSTHQISLTFHCRHDSPTDTTSDDDPRKGHEFTADSAPVGIITANQNGLISKMMTRSSQLQLTTAMTTNAAPQQVTTAVLQSHAASMVITGSVATSEPFEAALNVSVSLNTANDSSWDENLTATQWIDFDGAFQEHQEHLDRFWSRSDIRIEGNSEAQQAVRWHLFQLFQSSPLIENLGISAKGQTALGYDGHYFWDTEVFMLPFLAHAVPERTKHLLALRHSMLQQARLRASTLSQAGALYPWRTLSGEEASSYYPAGTAQYHINADIAWAIDRYVLATGDHDFLAHGGAQMVIETARMWADLAFEGSDGRWHIHGVTGPDEYSAVVNDNAYTNSMAARNLRLAARLARDAALHHLDPLSDVEMETWIHIADHLVIPFDDTLGIYAQDDQFLSRRRWDLSDIPQEKFPLLLHLHPLVIYRHQLIKQADVVLAMLLVPEAFRPEALRETFRYYEGVTTGDSSLSAAIQATAAATVNYVDVADHHFDQALFLDLANTHGNTGDGVHLANSGGIWSAVIVGMAGLTMRPDGVELAPTGWCVGNQISALIHIRGSLLQLTIRPEGTTIELKGGKPIALISQDHHTAIDSTPVFVPAIFPSTPQHG